jgi:hypothetical protein
VPIVGSYYFSAREVGLIAGLVLHATEIAAVFNAVEVSPADGWSPFLSS